MVNYAINKLKESVEIGSFKAKSVAITGNG